MRELYLVKTCHENFIFGFSHFFIRRWMFKCIFERWFLFLFNLGSFRADWSPWSNWLAWKKGQQVHMFEDEQVQELPWSRINKYVAPKVFRSSISSERVNKYIPWRYALGMDNSWLQIVVTTKRWHTERSRVCQWYSRQILASSAIYYWTDVPQLGIMLMVKSIKMRM